MFNSIKLVDFRNFCNKEFFFGNEKNFIIWANWIWKTNLLEAICLIYQKNIQNKEISSLINKDKKFAYIELKNTNHTYWISFDKENNQKKLLLNWKKTTKKKFEDSLEKLIIFKPMDMNMMYLSPSYRRDFIDDILNNCFCEYEKINKDYKNIIRNRNKVLKNIRDWKSTKNDLFFWNNAMISKAILIYNYRKKLNSFFESNIEILKNISNINSDNIYYKYITKIDYDNIENSIKKYLDKNIDRDIIIWNTHIWPHVDDFEIYVNTFSLINYASRWETKSIIIWLKILESRFIEYYSQKETIFLIDDLFSELDEIHENLLLNEINNKQIFITSIKSQKNVNNCCNFINL